MHKFNSIVSTLFFSITLLSCSITSFAGATDTAFVKTANERAAKIVDKITFKSAAKKAKCATEISMHYQRLHQIYDWRDSSYTALKAANVTGAAKASVDTLVTLVKQKITAAHQIFIKKLSGIATDSQVIAVKDGLTYGVVPLTYGAYQDMLPQLTEAQKKQIYAWLVEAREYAMDAESSDKKHAWFGKYKGRINNYLSAAGIDMRAEGEKWQQRIKERNSSVNK